MESTKHVFDCFLEIVPAKEEVRLARQFFHVHIYAGIQSGKCRIKFAPESRLDEKSNQSLDSFLLLKDKFFVDFQLSQRILCDSLKNS